MTMHSKFVVFFCLFVRYKKEAEALGVPSISVLEKVDLTKWFKGVVDTIDALGGDAQDKRPAKKARTEAEGAEGRDTEKHLTQGATFHSTVSNALVGDALTRDVKVLTSQHLLCLLIFLA